MTPGIPASPHLPTGIAMRRAWAYVLAGIDHDPRAIHRGMLRSFDPAKGSWVKPYPEVTGYAIRGMLEAGRILRDDRLHGAALEMGRALLRLQVLKGPATGAVPAADLLPQYYTFDTAQALEGLISLHNHTPDSEFLDGAVRAGEFCLTLQEPKGSFLPAVIDGKPYTPRGDEDWGLRRSYIQLRGSTGWHALSRATGDSRFARMAVSCREWVLSEINELYPHGMLPPCRPADGRSRLRSLFPFRRPKLPERATYSHPGAYVVRGLVEDFLATGEPRSLKQACRIVKASVLPWVDDNGYLPYGVSLDGKHAPVTGFSYVSGEPQYAWVLYRLWQLVGEEEFLKTADRLLLYAARVQGHAAQGAEGGLHQYAGPTGEPRGEIHGQLHVWGTKFFAEALMLQQEILSARNAAPGRTVQLVAPWAMWVVQESAPPASPDRDTSDLSFRAVFGSGPVTLSVRPACEALSVRDESGREADVQAIPGLPGLFRLEVHSGEVWSVTAKSSASSPLQPPQDTP
ncbi:MAG: hypothetical protein KAW17_00815 [Candidatus Eisenbacteria sp.]|nr:hypothetical protein [Candidatus Eisenbacteria bacterium]